MPRLDDGHSTTIAFADAPGLKLYQKTVTPPGLDAGGANDTTTMGNVRWRTRAPKKLLTLSNSSFTAAYDPAVFADIVNQMGNNQAITITFPLLDTYVFWGWIDKFTPNSIVEGEQPTAEVEIAPSNQTDAGVETGPVYNLAA